MAASIKAPVNFTARDNFTPVVKRMSKSVSGFSRKASVGVARVEHRFNRLTRPIKNVSRQLGSLGLLAGGLAIGTIFSSITTFETGMVAVGKTTDTTGVKLDKLGTDFINLSNDMRGISVDKLTEVGAAAGQLGVQGSDNILKFSETMVKLERSSDVAGEQGAKSIARLLSLTGEGVGVVDKFAASLVELGNNSAASEGEILKVATEVGKSTAAFNLTSSEILGMSAAMKSLGARPESAGTAIGKTFRSIESAVANGGKELQSFSKITGMTAESLGKNLDEKPNLVFTSLIKGLQKVKNNGGNVSAELQKLGLTGEGIAKTITPLASNFNLLNDSANMASDAFKENTALNKENEAASKTVATALEDVRNSFTNVLLAGTATNGKLDILRETLLFVSDNMDTIIVTGSILAGTFVAIKAAIIVSKVALAAYNVVMGINIAITQNNKRAVIGNTVAQGAYRVAMIAGAAATGIASAAQYVFAAAVNASIWPLTLIVLAIAAIIAVIMNWSSITEWFGEKWEQFTNWISKLWNGVVKFFEEFSFIDFFKKIGNAVIDYMLFPLKSVLKLLSNIPGKVGDLASKGLEVVEKIKFDKEPGGEVLPSTNQASNQQTQQSIRDSRVNIDVRDKGNNVERVEQDGDEVEFNTPFTTGAFAQ